MVDPMLEAARAHTKEPEEVDWQKRFEEVSDKFWELAKKYMDRTDDLIEARAENKRLKDVILRLEQRHTDLDQQYKRMIMRTAKRMAQLENPMLTLGGQHQVEHGLVTCNDCGKLLYRSAKDLHKCEGQSDDHIVEVSPDATGLDSLKCRLCNEVYVRAYGHDCKERNGG